MTAPEHHDAEVIDLEDFLAGDAPDFDTAPAAPADLDQAERYLRHIRRLTADSDRAREVAEAQRTRVDLWLSVELDRIGRQLSWFEQALAQLHASRLAEDPKAKTIHLPSGSLKSRAQSPVWDFDDEEAFVAWAAEHDRPGLVRIPPPPAPKPDRTAAKKALTISVPDIAPGENASVVDAATGEVVPGVSVIGRGPSFFVDLAAFVSTDDEDGAA